jgi:hypothetical protein
LSFNVLSLNNLTFIPDSISTNDLLRLQVNAEPDFVPDEPPAVNHQDDEDLSIESFIEVFTKAHPSPIAAKKLCLRLLSQLGAWHDVIADKKFEENDGTCLLWAGDEKLIHMAFSCLEGVDLGDQRCECDND